jgi:hypothetical protein
MNTKKTVFSRIAKGMTKKKVNLSIVDDIESEYDSLEEAYSLVSYYGYERLEELENKYYDATNDIRLEIDEMAINSSAGSLEEYGERMESLVAEFQTKADELGIDPSESIASYEEIVNMLSNYKEMYQDFIRKYRDTINVTGNNDFL